MAAKPNPFCMTTATAVEADQGESSERVLVLAPIGRDAPAAVALLREQHIAAEICKGLSELREGLTVGAGVAVVAEEAFYREPLEPIVDWVEGQSSWSDFPFIVLTAGRGTLADRAWRGRLLAALRNVSLLERPIQAVTLTSAVQSALRARQRQYGARAAISSNVKRRLPGLKCLSPCERMSSKKRTGACARKSPSENRPKRRCARFRRWKRSAS
jgi:hypothetical protein